MNTNDTIRQASVADITDFPFLASPASDKAYTVTGLEIRD